MIKNDIFNKKIVINNLLLNYYFLPTKNKSEKAIIFLHGWGVNSKIWFKLLKDLNDFNIYLIDFPGFGESQVPNTAYNVNDYKKVVIEFIKKLSLKNIILVGHSFGGRITMKLASENPEYLKKIVLVDTAGVVTASKLKKMSAMIARMISPIFKLSFMQPLRKKLYFLLGSEYLENEKLSKIFSKIVSEDLTNLLKLIKNPTLIIWGENDNITPLEYGQIMHKLIQNSKLVILKKADHFSFINQPEEFVKSLKDFI